MMEALTSLSSRIFARKCINSVSLRSRACFGRTQLQFLQPQKLSNVDSSLSFDLQRKPIGFLSCSLSSSDEQTDCDNIEDHIQATDLPGTVHVRFQLQQECLYGEKFLLVGDDPIIGLWDPSNAIPLTWSDGHVWTVDLDIPVGKALQFKFILKEITGEIVWQPGPDRALHTWETKNMITVLEDWENAEVQKITEELMADPNEGSLVNPNMEDMTVTDQNVMVDINQEMTVAENITHPNEELVANANPELLAAENFNHPKDEEMITVNEGEFIAENTTHPEEDLTANVKKEVTKEESNIHSNEEPKTHAKIELTAADNTLGSNGRTLSDKIPVFINNKENMITCKGPVLVPGLTPLPTVAMLNTEEVEETDVASACDEADEAKDCPAPEKNQLNEKQEPGGDPYEEETMESVFNDETKGELYVNIPEERPHLANEQELPNPRVDGIQKKSHLTNEKGQSNPHADDLQENFLLTNEQEQSNSIKEDGFEEKPHLANEQVQLNSQSDDVNVLQNDVQWGLQSLRKFLLYMGLLLE